MTRLTLMVPALLFLCSTLAIAEETDFKPLFNEKDFDGWVGDTDGYFVKDGAIVCDEKKGGNLYTKQQYGDFILKFEFRLPAGANNGLAIRTPLKGNPAYIAMELQILDNSAERYKNLQPYQYHGSVYGVVPAKRGFQKPVGDWNTQEVHIKGDSLKVILNGEEILKADLKQLRENPTMDGQKHPGLSNEKGHLGFLGHGAAVAFRKIRIKTLD